MRKILLLLFLFCVFPIKSYAVHEVIDSRCTTELKTKLREEAKDFTYMLSRVDENGNSTYTMHFYAISENLNIVGEKGIIYTNNKIDGLKPGSSFTLNFYANNKNYCESYKAYSRIIKVPYYNKYYNSELCDGYEDFSLCKKDININLSKEEFQKRLNEYKESIKEKPKDEEVIVEPIVQDVGFNLYDFVMNNIYYVLYGIIFFGTAGIIIILIKEKERRGIL